jgi:hypothetical protein
MPGRGGASALTKVSWFRVIVTHPEGMRGRGMRVGVLRMPRGTD